MAELVAQLKVTQLASRSDDIAAQAADVRAAREQLVQAEWKLAQKSQLAPKGALVGAVDAGVSRTRLQPRRAVDWQLGKGPSVHGDRGWHVTGGL